MEVSPAPATTPRPAGMEAMEFLSRSWTAPAPVPPAVSTTKSCPLEVEEAAAAPPAAGSSFSFASSPAAAQLVMEKIMPHSRPPPQEPSPVASGRLSHGGNGPLIGSSVSDSPPGSPEIDDGKYYRASSTPKLPAYRGAAGSKTVGRWLKDRREKKKEETRSHNAQVHAAVSVAAVAAAVAAVAAATASASSGSGKDDRAGRTDTAVASAATLVAAQCVEAAESMGADRELLAAAVSSAVNVRTPGDIITITAAAATALRGASTLKARAFKEMWNAAVPVIPVEKGGIASYHKNSKQRKEGAGGGSTGSSSFSDETVLDEENHSSSSSFQGLSSQELLARGTELLKRTRKGALHSKIVSVYINKLGIVMLKMKSRHVAGTITKKKKCVVVDVCKDVAPWPGRSLLQGGEQCRYFGLRTAEHRVIEFECRSEREHEIWTQGVRRLLSIAGERRRAIP